MRKLSHLFWFFLHWIYFLIPDCNSTQIIKLLKWRSEVKSLSRVQPFATPRTVAYKAPLSVEFSRQEYWSGLSFPSPGDLPDPGIEPGSPALQADSLPTELWRKPMYLQMHESVSLRVLSKALWAAQSNPLFYNNRQACRGQQDIFRAQIMFFFRQVTFLGSVPGGSDGKESICNAGDLGSIPGSGRSPGEENGNLLLYPYSENSLDRGAWRATVQGVAKSRICLSG